MNVSKGCRKGLWLWPATPDIDEDGLADFSQMAEKD